MADAEARATVATALAAEAEAETADDEQLTDRNESVVSRQRLESVNPAASMPNLFSHSVQQCHDSVLKSSIAGILLSSAIKDLEGTLDHIRPETPS